MSERLDLAALMPTVAKALLGDPVRENSSRLDWRYGSKGSLSVRVDKGTWFDFEADKGGGVLDLIRRERRCSVGEALKWLESIGEYVPAVRPVEVDRQRDMSLRDAARRIWQEAGHPAGTAAERYLVSRGLAHGVQCSNIRFHARCPFGKDEVNEQRFVPAMVALVRHPGTGEPMGVHRTELTPAGRKLDRKMLGPCHGGVVMLAPTDDDGEIGVCEGIETGLAVMALGCGKPVWAALSAGSLGSFAPLGGVRRLTIYGDNDAAGLEAAQKCARRWIEAGTPVTIEVPKEMGADYADMLVAEAEALA